MRKVQITSLCFLAVAAVPALATTTEWSVSAGNWESDIQSATLSSQLTFSAASTAGGPWTTPVGFTDGGYIFSGPDGSNWFLQSFAPNGTYGLASEADGQGSILISLPGSGLTAMYLLVDAIDSSNSLHQNDNMTIGLYSGSNLMSTDVFSSGTSGAIGFSTSYMVTSVLLSPEVANDGVFLTGLYSATSNLPPDSPPAAEAATIALVGGGILVLFGVKRRFARKLVS